MKRDILIKMAERSRSKSDGVYSLDGFKYLVKDKGVYAFIEERAVYLVVGHFVTRISGDFKYQSEAVKAMLGILKRKNT